MEAIDLMKDLVDLRKLKIGDILVYKPDIVNKEEFESLSQEEKYKLGTIVKIGHKDSMTTFYNFIGEELVTYIDELYIP